MRSHIFVSPSQMHPLSARNTRAHKPEINLTIQYKVVHTFTNSHTSAAGLEISRLFCWRSITATAARISPSHPTWFGLRARATALRTCKLGRNLLYVNDVLSTSTGYKRGCEGKECWCAGKVERALRRTTVHACV